MRDESGFEARGVGYLLLAFAMCCLPAGVFAQAQPSALPGYADVAAPSAQPDTPGSEDSSAAANSDPATLAQAAALAQSTSAPAAADKQPSPPAAQAPTPAAAAEAKPPDEIVPIKNVHRRWGTYDLAGHPEYTFNPFDPYHQNTLKADYPIGNSDWFVQVNALNNLVYKSRSNLDFRNALPGTTFHSHNNFFNEDAFFGFELRHHQDVFVPSNFKLHLDGVFDHKQDVNAVNNGTADNFHVFDAFMDIRLFDSGHDNFDLTFLRAGIQAFQSDFHGLIFNDEGLGGRIFGEFKKNRIRYDIVGLKLFQKNAVSGFIDFSKPSRHQVGIFRFTYEDFLVKGWNSEWSVHFNYDPRDIAVTGHIAGLNTIYYGGTLNGHLGRWIFNPAFYGVAGKADHVVAGAPVKHTVSAFTGLADLQYPLDFVKFRLGYAYVSGDGNPNDNKDRGFDSISDAVQLFGGPISYFVGEDIKFGAGDLVRANSFYPSLRGGNGQANYVNPGLQLLNGGMDVTISPRFQLALNANYTRFNTLGAFANAGNTFNVFHKDAGIEGNAFLRIKPFLHTINQNVVLDLGVSALNPLQGLQDIFKTDKMVYSTFVALRLVY
ncbi:MAG TPA: hypothetical protein VGZ28_05495 [Terriglobales bacterium]|jgi:hypothetical protein|nr:hypothetical protein [Terriglobales bacterium]